MKRKEARNVVSVSRRHLSVEYPIKTPDKLSIHNPGVHAAGSEMLFKSVVVFKRTHMQTILMLDNCFRGKDPSSSLRLHINESQP